MAGAAAATLGHEMTSENAGHVWQSSKTGVWVTPIVKHNITSGLSTPVFLGFLCGSAGKESTCNAEDLGSIPGLGRSPEGGKGNPLQYSGLENSMDYTVHGVAKSQIPLSDFHFQAFFMVQL